MAFKASPPQLLNFNLNTYPHPLNQAPALNGSASHSRQEAYKHIYQPIKIKNNGNR